MLTKDQKAQQVEDLSRRLSEAKSVVFTKYRGVKIKDMETLRKTLKSQKVSFQVVKNTLLKRAFEGAGKSLPEELLTHPLAIAFGSEDDMSAPKAIVAFSKDTEALEVAGGIFEDEVVDAATIKAIALLPGREELYAKVVGSLAAPLSRLVGALQYNTGALVSVLRQRLDQIN